MSSASDPVRDAVRASDSPHPAVIRVASLFRKEFHDVITTVAPGKSALDIAQAIVSLHFQTVTTQKTTQDILYHVGFDPTGAAGLFNSAEFVRLSGVQVLSLPHHSRRFLERVWLDELNTTLKKS